VGQSIANNRSTGDDGQQQADNQYGFFVFGYPVAEVKQGDKRQRGGYRGGDGAFTFGQGEAEQNGGKYQATGDKVQWPGRVRFAVFKSVCEKSDSCEGSHQQERASGVAGCEEASDTPCVKSVLKHELLEGAGLDAEGFEYGLWCPLVLVDGHLVADEELLGALVGRDYGESYDAGEQEFNFCRRIQYLHQQDGSKRRCDEADGFGDCSAFIRGDEAGEDSGRAEDK